MDLTGFPDGTLTIAVTASQLGTQSAAATYTVVKDTEGPTVSITAPSSLGLAQSATITFTLSEATTDFAASDITASTGTLAGFTGSGTRYTARYTAPATAGTVTLTVGAAAFTDAPGNPSRAATRTLTIAEQNIQATIAAVLPAGATAVTAGDPAIFEITLSATPSGTLPVAVTIAQTGNFIASTDSSRMRTLQATSNTLRLTIATEPRAGTEDPGTITATITSSPGYTPGTPATAELTVIPRTNPQALQQLNEQMLAHVALTLSDEMASTLNNRMTTLLNSGGSYATSNASQAGSNSATGYGASPGNALKIRGQTIPAFIASLARTTPHRQSQATSFNPHHLATDFGDTYQTATTSSPTAGAWQNLHFAPQDFSFNMTLNSNNGTNNAAPQGGYHSPLEGESASQGRSPQASRWGAGARAGTALATGDAQANQNLSRLATSTTNAARLPNNHPANSPQANSQAMVTSRPNQACTLNNTTPTEVPCANLNSQPATNNAALQGGYHSPLEGESASQGRSPQASRWGGGARAGTALATGKIQPSRSQPPDAELGVSTISSPRTPHPSRLRLLGLPLKGGVIGPHSAATGSRLPPQLHQSSQQFGQLRPRQPPQHLGPRLSAEFGYQRPGR